MKRISLALILILSLVTLAWAARSTPLRADFLPNLASTGYGVSDDGDPSYINGVQSVKCYFGVNNGNLNLVTYSTGRKLSFRFDPASSAYLASTLPRTAAIAAEVDLYGINYYGQFQSMGLNTTAQLKASFQFKVDGQTYDLTYSSLAVKRTSTSTWLITYDPVDVGGNPGFTPSDQAELSVFRKRTRQVYGAVNMPIRFEVTLL